MEIIPSIIVLIFFFDLLDSSTGMGLGTLSAPALLLMGYSILQVIPVLVIDAAISGWISGWFHHELRNVHYSVKRPLNQATRTLLLIAGIGCFAIIGAVILAYFSIKFPDVVIKTWVATLILFMAFVSLSGGYRRKRNQKYRPRLLAVFAGLAGINKGVGGGGYGPVVVLGGILSGIYEKTAAAISQTAEGIVSTAGAAAFFTIMAAGVNIDLILLPSMFTGTFFASILGPYTIRVVPNKVWRVIIPAYAFTIGAVFLMKIFLL